MSRNVSQTAIVFLVAAGFLVAAAIGLFGLQRGTVQSSPSARAAQLTLSLEPVADGLTFPSHVTNAGDGSGRLFVVELPGAIRVIVDGELLDTPFLDLRGQVATGWEQGMLNVVFHPDYPENGRFFVNYVSSEDDSGVISEFRVSADDANRADLEERVLLRIPNERKAHYGGQMLFGPDGYLYIAVGDGMVFGGARRKAQDLSILPGKLLRIDIDSETEPYGIPEDNPFVDRNNARQEIWAFGFRNPWRFAFDDQGKILLGDVGHERYEEIDLVERGGNYGWPFYEGTECLVEGFRAGVGCRLAALRGRFKQPIVSYPHLGLDSSGGNAITGGHVYRGERFPALQGLYVFGDYVSGRIWVLERVGRTWTSTEAMKTSLLISSFGEDEEGELYLTDWGAGELFRIALEDEDGD